MTQGRSYGDYLREAREQKGIDLVSMARALHIRPDIVDAIECANFQKLPAHGYCKNMVRAYAQKLGLNENELYEMYTAEREAYEGISYSHSVSIPSSQVSRKTSRSQNVGPRSREVPSQSRARSQSLSQKLDEQSRSRSHRNTRRSQSASRSLNSRSIPLESSQSLTGDVHRPEASLAGFIGSIMSSRADKTPRMNPSFTQGGSLTGMASSRFSSSQKQGGRFQGFSLPALHVPLVGIVTLVVIVLIILVVVFSNGGKQAKNEVPSIPISGLTDTSSADQSEQSKLAAAPSSAVFTFNVAEGKKAWIQIFQDGAETPVYAAVATGPISKNFDVTGTLKFETANISAVTLTLDGDEVQATPSGKGTNYTYSVDFPSILKAWKKAHDITDSDTTSTNSAASNKSSSSSSQTSSAQTKNAS